MRRFVTGPLLVLAMLSWAALASAQSGEVVVPPGYGAGSPSTTGSPSGSPSGTVTASGTLVVPATSAPGQFVTAPPPVPAGHWENQVHERSIRGLWLTGLIALPVSWLLTWSVSSTALPTYSDGVAYSYIPIVGPWLMLMEPLNGYDGFAITMGIVQGAAAIVLVLGLVLREEVEERVWVVGDLGGGRTLSFDGTSAALHF